ncbi:hypothetical protein PS619_04523 [Pseudomonas fluorescens]|nr:hypothetical protein PS619_04523 [Pseudomonas fluorescens]
MAVTAVRPCVVCNAPMNTQRSTKQTCSDRCTKAHYRAKQRQQAIPTIKTEEVHTMSQLFQPDAAHLKRLQDFEVGQYKTRPQCNIQGREQLGIMEEFEVQGLQNTLDEYVRLIGLGYTSTGEIAHLPKVIAGPTVDWVILSLRKPESQVEQEIAQIKADVEATYLAQLADAKAACVAKEVESLLAGEKRRKQQAEIDVKAAQEAEEYARVEAEVLAALGGKQ